MLSAPRLSPNEVELVWDASTDVGSGAVPGCNVYRDGLTVGSTDGTFFGDAGVAADTMYVCAATAFDNAHPLNESAESAIATATTAPYNRLRESFHASHDDEVCRRLQSVAGGPLTRSV